MRLYILLLSSSIWLGLTISSYSIQPSQAPQQESGVPMWYWDELMSEYGRPSYKSFGSDSTSGGSSSYNAHGGGGGGGGYSRSITYRPTIDPYAYRPITFTPNNPSTTEQPSFSYYDADRNSVLFWSNEPGQLSIPICLNGDVKDYNNPVTVYVNGQQVYQEIPTLNSNLTFNVSPNSLFNNDQIQWLSDHKTEGMNLINAMVDDGFSEDGNGLAQYLVNAGLSGVANGPGNGWLDGFIWGLLHWYWPFEEITQTAIDNIKRDVAIYRLEHPEAKNDIFTPYYAVLGQYIHLAFDAIGLIPVIGDGFDLTNGILYELEGDHFNAGISFAASIPLAGWAATGAKWAFAAAVIRRGGGYLRPLKWIIKEDGLIDFGEKTLFKDIFKASNKVKVSQTVFRIIPWSLKDHPVVQAAARASDRLIPAFHINSASNGVALERWRFKYGALGENEAVSSAYDEKMKAYLDLIWIRIKDFTEANRLRAARAALKETQERYGAYLLQKGPYIDDLPMLPPNW